MSASGSESILSGDESSGTGETKAAVAESIWLAAGMAWWCTCSFGMIVFNKVAIQAFPAALSLVALQFAFAALVMVVFCWHTLHVGSVRDFLRWCLVVPFFIGMIMSSILALKNAPMTLVMTFRGLSPLLSLVIERFYPKPLRVSAQMVCAILGMIVGVLIYVYGGVDTNSFAGACWAMANNFLAVGDRLLQRLMLSPDEDPVDISKTGVTFLNNFLGMIPLLVAAGCLNEFASIPGILSNLQVWSAAAIAMTCVIGVCMSYTGVWVQSRISATSFLVLVNSNKFLVIFVEAFIMREKALGQQQILGASLNIFSSIAYGWARAAVESEAVPEKAAEVTAKMLEDSAQEGEAATAKKGAS